MLNQLVIKLTTNHYLDNTVAWQTVIPVSLLFLGLTFKIKIEGCLQTPFRLLIFKKILRAFSYGQQQQASKCVYTI